MKKKEINQLENCLQRLFDDPPGIDEIQATFAAAAIGPRLIKSSEWMYFLFGGEDGLPKFKSKKEAGEFMGLLFRFYNDTVQSIQENHFEPLFMMIEDSKNPGKEIMDPESWCLTFHEAMFLHGEDWMADEDEEFLSLLLPIEFFLDQESCAEAMRIKTRKKLEKLRKIMLDSIPWAVIDVRDYFKKNTHKGSNPAGQSRVLPFGQQDFRKVGRNDPCPCGSGKKYKLCCGSAETKEKKSMLAYQFKVALMYDKGIYRTIEILGNQTLDDLHEAIFDAFDRYDAHLYSFFLTREKTKNRRKIYDAPEYTPPMGMEDADMFSVREKYNAEKTPIEELQLNEKDTLYYLFDFGDEWWHELTVLSIQEDDKSVEYPRVVKKAGESPEQYPDEDEDEDF